MGEGGRGGRVEGWKSVNCLGLHGSRGKAGKAFAPRVVLAAAGSGGAVRGKRLATYRTRLL